MDKGRLKELLHTLATARDDLDEAVRAVKNEVESLVEDRYEFLVYPLMDKVNKTLEEIQLLVNEEHDGTADGRTGPQA